MGSFCLFPATIVFMQKQKTMDMVHGPLVRNILIFSVPLMVSNLLQIAFNAADTIIVGKFSGQAALAAVGATGSLVNLIVSLFNGLAIGANIVIARQIGRNETDRISASVHSAFLLAVTGGILLTCAGLVFSPLLLKMMGTPQDIISMSVLYLRIYYLGSLPLLIYNFGAAILRSGGDTTRPTVYLMISGILNVFLNLFFVILLKMSVAGVALATVMSESVSAVLITRALLKEEGNLKLDIRKLSFDRELTVLIMKIGIPAGVQSMMWAISNVTVQSAINSFGSVAVAGNAAAANVESFVYIGMGAFSQAAITFTSQNAGAGEHERIRTIMVTVLVLIVASSWSIGALAWYFGRNLLAFYTNDPAVIDAGMVRMWYIVFWLFLNGILDVPASSMRGMGYSTLPTVLMMVGIVAVRLLYIRFIWTANPTLDVLYFCFPLSWVITCVLQFGFWLRCWKHNAIA